MLTINGLTIATPRTDERAFRILSELQSGTREVVDADLARTMEFELQRANADAVEFRKLARERAQVIAEMQKTIDAYAEQALEDGHD